MSTAVVTSTVRQRRRQRELTLCQWRAIGVTPIVVEQDPATPLGHSARIITGMRSIRAGLSTSADTIIHAEDDINIDPHILHCLAQWDRVGPLSMWSRPRFRPHVRGVHPALHTAHWWGAQCVALTRGQATCLLTLDTTGARGFDILLRQLGPMRVSNPVLAEHRPLPRLATSGPQVTSGMRNPNIPDVDRLALRMWQWLPARRSKIHSSTPTIAAVDLHLPLRLVLMLFDGMLRAGYVFRDKSGYHRGYEPPQPDQPERHDPTLFGSTT